MCCKYIICFYVKDTGKNSNHCCVDSLSLHFTLIPYIVFEVATEKLFSTHGYTKEWIFKIMWTLGFTILSGIAFNSVFKKQLVLLCFVTGYVKWKY